MQDELRRAIHPDNLFKGLENADATCRTVLAWLSVIREVFVFIFVVDV